MKVLVCGSSGLVGNDLCRLLQQKQIDFVGIHNTRSVPHSYKINILDEKELLSFFDEQNPTVCVNCIADRNVDTCETNWEQTKRVNVDIVSNLAKICSQKNIFLIHVSTDYVFDGRSSPYTPQSEPNPLQNYGISKLLAELKVKAYATNYCIVRVPVLYTNTYHTLSETAVTLLGKKVMDRTQPTKEDDYSVRRPVFIPDLCSFLLDCIQTRRQGVYHFYNPTDKTTKYEMCTMIANYLETSSSHISPVSTPPSNNANRPYDTDFTDNQYDRNAFPVTTLQDGIAKCFEKFWHPPLSSINNDVLYLIDLDGTLVDTDRLHYNSYKQALGEVGIPIDWDSYEKDDSIGSYLQSLLPSHEYYMTIRKRKAEIMKETKEITMVQGAEELLSRFQETKTNYVVVTNTSRETVNHFKSICKPLQSIQNWITRDDCTNLKPHQEPYETAIKRYGKGESYIVGLENTVTGYKSLQSLTSRIYILTEHNSHTHKTLKHKDCYLIPDLKCLYTKEP